MSRQIEADRRKDNCVECKNYKPIKAKDMCQNCWHKYKRKNEPNFFLRTRYTELKQRCINPNRITGKYYYGKKYCSLEEFLSTFLNDSSFLELFKNWQNSNWEYKLCPSIDRVNNSGNYTIDNLQFITHSQNSSKDQERTPVIQKTKEGVFIKLFRSQSDASAELRIPQANIWKVVNGERKTAGGFRFEYAS